MALHFRQPRHFNTRGHADVSVRPSIKLFLYKLLLMIVPQNSRLHFIGRWRSRYRKRFLSTTACARWSKPSVRSLSSSQKRVIIHVDMDCFFVSVVIRHYPELFDKPVAICHSDNARGTAEISSANYPARDYGVQAGMFVRDAKVLCPQLATFPYNFEAYEEVADQFYTILHEHCPRVQAISCDEAFLDVTDLDDDPEIVASVIRQQIAETTRCTASAGIAGNMLLARLATRSAKPNGQFCVWPEKVDDYLKELPIDALPGIGYSLEEKLKNRRIDTCGQLRLIPKESLQKDFGKKTGDMLWNYCRGIDNRMVDTVQEVKSVGAEVNWGIRFSDMDDCHCFLANLCKEVSSRLIGAGVKGRAITLKVKKRKEGAGEPIKYMGCGECENMSRSMTVSVATDSVDLLIKTSKQLFSSFHVDAKEVRGIGLQLSKLESADMNKQGCAENVLESWLTSTSETSGEPHNKVSYQVSERDNAAGATSWKNQASILPPMSHLDMNVIKCLPPEIISEMNGIYHGRLSDLIEKHEGESNCCNDDVSHPEVKHTPLSTVFRRASVDDTMRETKEHVDLTQSCLVVVEKGKQPVCSPNVSSYEFPTGSMPIHEVHKLMDENIPEAKFSLGCSNLYDNEVRQRTGASSLCAAAAAVKAIDRTDLMPTSLSQIDESILQQLPEELKLDLCKFLPAHRNSNFVGDPSTSFSNDSTYQDGIRNLENSKLHLWEGNPPKWVTKFKTGGCLMLHILAETYHDSGGGSLLSSILQSLIPLAASLTSSGDKWNDEAFNSGCEFFKEYVELKVQSDIEELYLCFLILKRLANHSKFLLCVYNAVLPYLQASVSANYGGMLQLSFAEQEVS